MCKLIKRLSRANRQPRVRSNGCASQRGVALVIALILLIVVTLVGLAGIRGTTMQEKMAGNFYDRELAFQSAEAGLREAESLIGSGANPVDRDCSTGAVGCESAPGFSGSWHEVNGGDYTSRYFIERLGESVDSAATSAFGATANDSMHGGSAGTVTRQRFRVTSISADPSTVSDRAIVTLQSTYQR